MIIKRRHRDTSFIDLLFNLLVGMTCLFVLSFLLIAEQKKKDDSNLKTKAEYIITVVWPDGALDDVDTWLEDPRGQVLWYHKKDINSAHLDRDDLGRKTDTIIDAKGNEIEYPHNQEITTIRVPMEGEWVLNLHMYRKSGDTPILVEVKMDKLNPTVKTVFLQRIVMTKHWEEVTVARFQMSKMGEILTWDKLPKELAQKEVGGHGYMSIPTSMGPTRRADWDEGL